MTAATSVTRRPASRTTRAVPPVDTSSKPRASSPRATLDESGLVGHREQRPARTRWLGSGLGEQRRDDLRQEHVLHGLDALVERVLVVGRQDRDCPLRQDRPAVDRLVDEVDGGSRHSHAGRERVADRMGARERGQQGGVQVDDPAAERIEDARAEQPHVARQDDEVGRDRDERHRERRVGLGDGLGVPSDAPGDGHERGLDPLLRRPREPGTLAIREDERDLGAQCAPAGGRDERLEARARARDADGDPLGHRAASTYRRPPSSSTGRTSPIGHARSP